MKIDASVINISINKYINKPNNELIDEQLNKQINDLLNEEPIELIYEPNNENIHNCNENINITDFYKNFNINKNSTDHINKNINLWPRLLPSFLRFFSLSKETWILILILSFEICLTLISFWIFFCRFWISHFYYEICFWSPILTLTLIWT